MSDSKYYLLGIKNASQKIKFTSLAVGADGRSRVHRDVFGVVGNTGAMGCVRAVIMRRCFLLFSSSNDWYFFCFYFISLHFTSNVQCSLLYFLQIL
jgi:hypothetical protein